MPNLSYERLAEVLDLYTNPVSPEYDAVFDKMIRAAAPEWFKDRQSDAGYKPNVHIKIPVGLGDGRSSRSGISDEEILFLF